MEQSGTGFNSFHPEKSQIIYREEGFGKFSFQLQLYKNKEYVSQYPPDAYPVEVRLKERLYFEAKVSAQDWLELFIDTCVATQTMNPHTTPQFKFIHEGWEVFISIIFKQTSTFKVQGVIRIFLTTISKGVWTVWFLEKKIKSW